MTRSPFRWPWHCALALALTATACDLPGPSTDTTTDGSAAGGSGGAGGSGDPPDASPGGTGGAPTPDASTTPTPDAAPPAPDAAVFVPQRASAMVGPEGGRVAHPGGAALDVPPGALGAPVEISIENRPAPAAVGASTPVGDAFVLGPDGQHFARPVRVTLPVTGDAGPVGLFIASDENGRFAALATTADASGTLLTAETGHFSVVLAATPPGSFFITSGPALPPGVVDVPYGPVALEATGGTPPYVWSLTAGGLPAGLDLSVDGVLAGTPRDTAGPLLQVRAEDAAGAAVEGVLTLQITREPLPVAAALVPDSAPAGSGPLALEVQGAGFAPGDTILFDGQPLQTAFVADTSLTTTLEAALLLAPGQYDVAVERPGVGVAGALPFRVVGGGGAPVLTRLEPEHIAAGSPDTQVRVIGGGFTAAAVVSVDAAPVATGFVSDQELSIVVPAALLAAAGPRALIVADAGGNSNALTLTVGEPAAAGPPIDAVLPATIWSGAGDTRVNVSGMNFDPAGTLTLDGVPIATEFFHPGGVAGTVPGALVAAPGVHALRYENPPAAGGAGPSTDLTFVDLPFGPLRTLAVSIGGMYGVAGDATDAYWVDWNTGEVWRAPLDGQPPVMLASGQPRPYAIAVDATNVYWTNESFGLGQGSLMTVPKAGGVPVTLASGLSGAHNLALDGANVWLAEMWSAQLSRVSIAGGPLEVIATGLDGMSGLDVDATHVYFGPSDVQSGLRRLPLDAAPGTPPEIVAARQAPYDIDAGPSGTVYWVDQFNRNVMALSPGGMPTVFAPRLSAPHFVAEHAGYVFLGDRGAGGLYAQAIGDQTRVFIGQPNAPWDLADAPGGLIISFNTVVAFLPDAP